MATMLARVGAASTSALLERRGGGFAGFEPLIFAESDGGAPMNAAKGRLPAHAPIGHARDPHAWNWLLYLTNPRFEEPEKPTFSKKRWAFSL